MVTSKQESKSHRKWTPQQKFAILQEIRKAPSITEGLKQHNISSSQFYSWDRQLNVGINASLRSSKPVKPAQTKELERENRLLKEMVLNLSHQVCELKKTLSLPL